MGRKQNSHCNPTRCSINFSSFVMFSQLFTQTKELKVNIPRNQLLRPEYFYTAAHLVLFILFCQYISWFIPEYFRSCLLSCLQLLLPVFLAVLNIFVISLFHLLVFVFSRKYKRILDGLHSEIFTFFGGLTNRMREYLHSWTDGMIGSVLKLE